MTMNVPWKLLIKTATCSYYFEHNLFYRFHIGWTDTNPNGVILLDPVLHPKMYTTTNGKCFTADKFDVGDMKRIKTYMKNQHIFARHVHYDPNTKTT